MRGGILKEELRSRHFPFYNLKIYQALLKEWEQEGKIAVGSQTVGFVNYKVSLSPKDQDIIDKIRAAVLEGNFQPPGWRSIAQELDLGRDQEHLLYLLREGDLVKLSEDIYIHKNNLDKAEELVGNFLVQSNEISISETRDLLNTSRKYILPLLEYFDKAGLTERTGDVRILKQKGRP